MEFLVNIEFTVPLGTTDQELADRRARESLRARELSRSGHLLRLWRPKVDDDRWANIGVWNAESEEQLRTILSTLPLYSWAEVSISPLNPHPNDPGRSGLT